MSDCLYDGTGDGWSSYGCIDGDLAPCPCGPCRRVRAFNRQADAIEAQQRTADAAIKRSGV